jgi:predicted Fe-Mo cluster-binding NifX family protein
MKIAIPTNDGLTIHPDFGNARGFLVLTVELGAITNEEMRFNPFTTKYFSAPENLDSIRDCQSVILNNINAGFNSLLSDQNKEIIWTKQTIITNACIHYLENNLLKASHTCCCP